MARDDFGGKPVDDPRHFVGTDQDGCLHGVLNTMLAWKERSAFRRRGEVAAVSAFRTGWQGASVPV